MSEEDRTRYGRAAMIIKQLYPKMMREMAEKNINASTLYGSIQRNAAFKSSLHSDEKEMVRSLQQTGYKKLDESFLYKVIRSFYLVDSPTRGWGYCPNTNTQLTQGDDVERMRRSRNCVIHRPSPHMDENEWLTFYTNLVEIAERCDSHLEKSDLESFKREARQLETQWLDVTKREDYIKALEKIFNLELQHKATVENTVLRIFYGDDVKQTINTITGSSIEDLTDVVLIDMFVHGVKDKNRAIEFLQMAISELQGSETEMSVLEAESGSILLHIRATKANFKLEDILFRSLENLFRRLLPHLNDYIEDELDVVMSIDTTKDPIVKDSEKWRQIRKETLPRLKNIEQRLTTAGNDLRDFRRARNYGTVLGILGIALAPFTGSFSLGFTIGAMTVGIGGVTLVTIVIEKYLTVDVLREAESRIDIDKQITAHLQERVNVYIHEGAGNSNQERLAKLLKRNFPDAIIRMVNKPFGEFLTGFIDTESGSVFKAREEIINLQRVLERELKTVEKIINPGASF